MTEKTKPENRFDQTFCISAIVFLTAILVWSYWNSLIIAANRWETPQYSHGYLVPLFALVLLWMRYEPFGKVALKERFWGLGLLSFGLGMRLVSANYGYEFFDLISFVFSLAGVFLLIGGWRVMKWAGPAVGFLFFMFPLSWRMEREILVPLKSLATQASTYVLQACGVAAFREGRGNIINLPEQQLNIIDACSGLRMLTIFIALSLAFILLIQRPWWERLIIALSSVPIALAVNAMRISATGLLYVALGQNINVWKDTIHNVAGWVMMPIALLLLYIEFWLLQRLFIEEETSSESRFVSKSGSQQSKKRRKSKQARTLAMKVAAVREEKKQD